MTDAQKVDFLIVGQGLAGSLMAFYLEKENRSIQVIDKGHEGASSKIAAGIINPITGRRFVKSWMIDELLPFAQHCYRELEALLDSQLLYNRSILRIFDSVKEENEWQSRSSAAPLQNYIGHSANLAAFDKWLHPAQGLCEIRGGLQVDMPLLIHAFRQYLLNKDCLLEKAFDYSLLRMEADGFRYQNIQAKTVIFCEGHQARFNPWFSDLPFVPSKGEVLHITAPDLPNEDILKRGIIMAPLPNNCFWVGSNYEWDTDNVEPTKEGEEWITERLQRLLKSPYQIETHVAAIRPTVKDRRPMLGQHPQHKRLYIFNGLGTKGSSLGPYWAHHLCQHLVHQIPLAKEVEIERFYSVAG